MNKALLALGVLGAMLSTGLAATTSAGAAAPVPGTPLTLAGTISTIANAGPGEMLTVIRKGNGARWSVALAPTTAVELNNGAASSYAALNVGDVVRVNGTFTAPRSLTATTIRDTSLVERASGVTGVVRFVDPSRNQIAIAVGHRGDDSFIRNGQFIYIDLAATTPITLLNGTAGTISSIAAGNVVRAAGIYDAAARALVVPSYVQVLPSSHEKSGCDSDSACLRGRHNLAGRLIFEPGVTAPTSLELRLSGGPTVTVLVSTSTAIMRRYDGAATLSQFALGDQLQVHGSFAAGSALAFNATSIEDVSQQQEYSGATIKLASFSQDTMTGQGIVVRGAANGPYHGGEAITLQFASNAAVVLHNGSAGSLADLSLLRYADHLYVSGRYDRVSHVLVVLRVHL